MVGHSLCKGYMDTCACVSDHAGLVSNVGLFGKKNQWKIVNLAMDARVTVLD